MGLRQPNREKLKQLVDHASRKAQSLGSDVLASYSENVDAVDPLDVFAAGEQIESERWYWEDPEARFAIVSIGNLVGTTPPRNVRFSEVDRVLKQYVSRSTVTCEGEPNDPGPKFFAAFSFDPMKTQDRLIWQGFPSTFFLTPRISLVCNGAHFTLTTNVLVSARLDPDMLVDSALELHSKLLSAIKQPAESNLIVDELPPDKADERYALQFVNDILRADASVRNEENNTIVVARQRKIVTGGLYRPPRLLRSLRQRYPQARLVAAGRHGSTFIGHADKPLLSVSEAGGVAVSVVTGNIRRGDDPALDAALATQLLNNDHDLDFHDECVEEVTDVIETFCDAIAYPDEPDLNSNADRHCLATSISARWRNDASTLNLLSGLHPAPAHTGVPSEDAFGFLQEHETTDRGWFTAPIGWLDANGSAEFISSHQAAVIRAPVLEQQRAYLFTATTINSGIDPESRLQATDQTLEPLRAALKQ